MSAAERRTNIGGWDLSGLSGDSPRLDLGSDPVLGRLACPPLTRFDLHDGTSEPFVLKAVTTPKATEWKFQIRPGVTWWSGAPVTSADVSAFVRQELDGDLQATVGPFFEIPASTISAGSDGSVTVRWTKSPAFGPFVFNGISLWRKVPVRQLSASGLPYECAGRYAPVRATTDKSQEISFDPTKSSGGAKRFLRFSSVGAKGDGVSFLSARAALEQKGAFALKESGACRSKLDLPAVTLIVWNSHSELLKDPAVRKLFTQITPRGEILRTGAGGFGDLLPGPIPRNHPGFASSLKVRPFAIEDAAAGMERLGYRRSSPEKPRLDKSGTPMTLKLATQSDSAGFVEKIVTDSFSAIGIDAKTEVIRPEALATYDGVFDEWRLPWGAMDMIQELHSKSMRTPWKGLLPANDSLDKNLLDYSQSISLGKPDFHALQRVGEILFQLEPFTVLMQHRVCLNLADGLTAASPNVDTRDPDWFWQMIQ